MEKQYRVMDFEEGKYYHLLGHAFGCDDNVVDKVKIYFVKDGQLFYKFRDSGASKSEGSYNDVINSKFVLADTFCNIESLDKGVEVEAKIRGEWRKRFFIGIKEASVRSFEKPCFLGFDMRDRIITVSPVNPRLEDATPYYEMADEIRIDTRFGEYIDWR